ncbi:MAG: hypothetical protein F6K42_09390, partial [Leptolyngbya sp. SIO1D8]|nr:hypothetical protein [Leptolyngbya sp. SIO1D8]
YLLPASHPQKWLEEDWPLDTSSVELPGEALATPEEDLSLMGTREPLSEAEQADLVSADSLPFMAEAAIILPDIPDFDESEPLIPENISDLETLDALPSPQEGDVFSLPDNSLPDRLNLRGSTDTGFDVAVDADLPVDSIFPDLPEEGFNFDRGEDIPPPSEETDETEGPLSEVELAELFPPTTIESSEQDVNSESDINPEVDVDLDLFGTEIQETPEGLDISEVDSETDDSDAVGSVETETEIGDEILEMPLVGDLSASAEDETASPASSEDPFADFNLSVEDESVSPDLSEDPLTAFDLSVEDENTSPASSEDPLAAFDLSVEDESASPASSEDPFADFDLSMEEIPPTEIENDEAFQSAFQDDFFSETPENAAFQDEDTGVREENIDLPGLDSLFDAVDEEILEASFAEELPPSEVEDTPIEEEMFSLENSGDSEVSAIEDALSSPPSVDSLQTDGEENTTENILSQEEIESTENLEDTAPPEVPEAIFAREEIPPTPPASPVTTDAAAMVNEPLSTSELLATTVSDETASDEGEPPVSSLPEEEWFLGLDIGTTGLSAVLMNRVSGAAHPLYWSERASVAGANTTFRLPAVAALKTNTQATDAAWQLQAIGTAALAEGAADSNVWLLNNLKPLLKVGIPHTTASGDWQPIINWTAQQTLPLQQVLAGVQALATLVRQSTASRVELGAAGLETTQLHQVLDNLQGVIVGHPTNWPDTYCINIREAILAARLVGDTNQVFFVEEAIAAILSGLPDPNEPPPEQSGQAQTLYQCNWQGGTIVISAGASCTELGMIDLPHPLDTLEREDFTLRHFSYGGNALDLDIICQLLMPSERRQSRAPGDRRQSSGQGWSWHPTLPEVTHAEWSSLELESLDCPQLTEPDESTRIHMRQHLEASRLGQSLLEAARYLKFVLQNQSQFQLDLADQSWQVLRRDLESRILIPYIQRLNQYLNALLSTTGLSSQGINQVICTGGNVSFATIAKWLRQKFPNATIIQDTYPSNRPPSCSRVAYGLVNLCRYPQVLDVARHQYSDYFLLNELVQTMPDQPLPLNGILHLLEERGVNVEACQSRILAILEGHLPPGLIPNATARAHLNMATLNHETYQDLGVGTLFTRQSGDIYMLNPQQRDLIRDHLVALLANKRQSLNEPLIAQLVVP